MTMSSTTSAAPPNDYLYNGKELQTELGLDWYDYGARMYDASIGRWNGVDALAEKYADYSSFSYVLNNPLVYVDPNGKDVFYVFFPNAPFGARISGHSGLMVGTPETGYTFYSSDGDNRTTTESFESLDDFAQRFASIGGYSMGYYVETNTETDELVRNSMATQLNSINKGESEYGLFSNNCADNCRIALEAGGLSFGEAQSFLGITWPKDEFNLFKSSQDGLSIIFDASLASLGFGPAEGLVSDGQSIRIGNNQNIFAGTYIHFKSDSQYSGWYVIDGEGNLNAVTKDDPNFEIFYPEKHDE